MGKVAFWGILLLIMAVCGATTGEFMVGGLSSDDSTAEENESLQKEAIPKVESEIRTKVASLLTSSSGESGSGSNSLKDAQITVLSYKTQVVAGVNYFVKARIGKFIFHLRIFRDLQGNYELSDVKGPMKETDPIQYF